MNSAILAGCVFVLAYALIVTERVHRTVSALLGGVAMVLLGILSQVEAFAAIDWNVIFLLIGMMIIADVLRETGLFQWIAIQAVRLGKGHPFRILLILALVTAAGSAFLDNVTMVVLVVPVTLLVAASLRVSPMPYLIAEILAANIGGTATLIGDPPNILIGSAADIDFLTFTANMAPISLLILFAFLGLARILFRKDLQQVKGRRLDLAALDASQLIEDRVLLRKALIVMAAVILGFLVHGALKLESATIAMAGATALLLWSGKNPHDVLGEIEWTTLFFFIGLFMMVEGVVKVGYMEAVARGALRLTGGSLPGTSLLLLWMSAIISAVVDNIPYTVTLIPVVQDLGKSMPVMPLWWALALGACLGGNGTLVGASANVVVASLAERSGQAISFKRFLKYGLVTMGMSLLLATGYLWLRYL